MSKKIRCGNIGIDLNQIWFWKRILPSSQGGSLQSAEEYLMLYTSNDTIMIRKVLPEGVSYPNDGITLEEKDFDKLLECLDEEFSCNLSEDSTSFEQAYGKQSKKGNRFKVQPRGVQGRLGGDN